MRLDGNWGLNMKDPHCRGRELALNMRIMSSYLIPTVTSVAAMWRLGYLGGYYRIPGIRR